MTTLVPVGLLGRIFHFFISHLRVVFRSQSSINGRSKTITFGDLYSKYKTLHVPTLSLQSQIKITERVERSLGPLMKVRLADFTPELIANFIRDLKANYQAPATKRKRYGFDKEVRDIKGLLNWYIENFDFGFKNPIKRFHLDLAVLEEMPAKERRIRPEELQMFLGQLRGIYKDIGIVAVFTSGRIGEVLGIQVKNIDLNRRILTIREVMTWPRGVPVPKLLPKNGKAREVYICDALLEIFTRRLKVVPKGCPFLFHNEGQAMRYSRINENFNRAWKRTGLTAFSGAHVMRYAGAQLARHLTNSLDAAAAVTGHMSAGMIAKYALLDTSELNKTTVIKMDEFMRDLGKTAA